MGARTSLRVSVRVVHRAVHALRPPRRPSCWRGAGWDLNTNQVVRHYHGHLSGVYCMALHPTLDILMTGGRDSVCRVWDMRTKAAVHVLAGHENTIASMITNSVDPQVITGSMDNSIRVCW
ncbi:hypothetical protein EON67_08285 [archaeon]|nr:MAG: hypothetical protein EON67_08285 [archaeon]